ncbi:MAG TPA: dockerin type I domain-containing protein, partial [Pirellulaceae bacterium]|nr:dockerin type I domain-containing protein [Pirellulaceae bacterium]
LTGATVRIAIAQGSQFNDEDVLTFMDTAKIKGFWDRNTETLRLVGTDTVANYQTALRAVKYQNISPAPAIPHVGTRTILFQVNDGNHTSNAATRDIRVSLLRGDYLFIGDQGDPNVDDPNDDTVKQFDVQTNSGYLGNFVAPGQLLGPRGLLFNGGNLLAVNQNVNQPFAGEVLRFNGRNGTAMAPVVSESDTQAPFAPRGIVVKDNVLYVADFLGADSPRIAKYNATTGQFIGDLRPSNFSAPFNPRGLVFGPDGKLYVTSYSADESIVQSNDPSGYILKFLDTTTGAVEVIAFNNGNRDTTPGKTAGLHNPEGVVFAPDGTLYVISFRFGASDNAILGFNVTTKEQVNSMRLGEDFGPSLLFGPDKQLYVAISAGPDAGSVRDYDLQGNFNIFVPPGGSLHTPWYMTFKQTNPATLAYEPWHNFVNPLDVDGDGNVVPLDVLIVINEVDTPTDSSSLGHLPSSRPPGGFYFDVNQDGFVAPIDALIVINFLNDESQAEGEANLLLLPISPAVSNTLPTGTAGITSTVSIPSPGLTPSIPVLPTKRLSPTVHDQFGTFERNASHAGAQSTEAVASKMTSADSPQDLFDATTASPNNQNTPFAVTFWQKLFGNRKRTGTGFSGTIR